MRSDRRLVIRGRSRSPHQQAMPLDRAGGRGVPFSKRARIAQRDQRLPFVPPEDWHEPLEAAPAGYKFVVQAPGEGYRHVVTPDEVRARLEQLPAHFLQPLQVVQFSRMTRK